MSKEILVRQCAYCHETFETTDARKIFHSKQCADRSRNLPRIPVGFEGVVPLKDFNRYPTDVKQRILYGETGERIVSFDLECTSLKPNVGRILCASFKPLNGEVYSLDGLDRRFKKRDVYDDGALALAIRQELEKYDIIVSWNGKEFDIKFLNSRLMRTDRRTKDAQYHIDGLWSWRSKSSAWAKLDSVSKFIAKDGERKTEVEWDVWMQALGWDAGLRRAAMDTIVDHCEKDVIVLEEVYKAMVSFNVFRSIKKDGGIL